MKYSYPHEVFNRAVETMVKGPGRLQDRIQEAGKLNFSEDQHFEAQLPKDIRERFNSLSAKVMSGEILKLDDEEALLVVKEIFHMYRVVEDHYYREVYSR